MEFNKVTIPARTLSAITTLTAQGAVTVQAGERLKIKINDTEIMNEKCPAGKVWQGIIKVEINETKS